MPGAVVCVFVGGGARGGGMQTIYLNGVRTVRRMIALGPMYKLQNNTGIRCNNVMKIK